MAGILVFIGMVGLAGVLFTSYSTELMTALVMFSLLPGLLLGFVSALSKTIRQTKGMRESYAEKQKAART